MKVELRIDPGCGGVSVVINAPALTDEVKALAARLEGRPVEPAAVEAAFRRAKARFPFVVAEGSGGIVCPGSAA